MRSIGKIFGRELGDVIKRTGINFDFVIPVPLHIAKYRERTYNQSEYICYGINEVTGIPVIENCLKRIRYTKSQTKLKFTERQKNVKDAFQVNKKYVVETPASGGCPVLNGKNIILTDDLITTGSTIFECARILKSAGCGKLLICSAAMAI